MVQYAMRVALAGGAFLMLQLWTRYRGKQSYDRFIAEQEHGSGKMTMEQVSSTL
jgi:hypothetical protein